MQINPVEEWRRLTEHYRALGDEELRELAADFRDLTEVAQRALSDEMKSRSLGDPQAPAKVPGNEVPSPSRFVSSVYPDARGGESDNAESDEEDDSPKEFTWKTPLCECDSAGQAWEINQALSRAGVESWIEQPGRDRVSTLRIVVAADQLDHAREIAAQPIPQDIIDEYNEEVPEYEPPRCPRCRATDPVLESVEPTNSWLCESCGKQWADPEEVPNEQQKTTGR